MKDRLLQQAKREYGPRQRAAALAAEAVVFLAILPLALARLGHALDARLGWPELARQPSSAIAGGLLMVGGWLLAVWTIYVQFTLGRGTPVPLMATQELVVRPPTPTAATPWPWAQWCSTWA